MQRKTHDGPTNERKSGRAVFEANGKTSWEWQTATGVFQQHVSEEQLQQLATADLQLVEYEQPRVAGRDSQRAFPMPASSKLTPSKRNVEVSPLRSMFRRLVGMTN